MTTVNISDYYAGDTLVMAFTVRDPRGRPVDLTGATASFAIAPVINARTVGENAISLTSDDGDITVDANVATVTLPKGEFTTPGDYRLELEIVLATGQSLTAARGDFKCLQALMTDSI